MNYKEAFTNIFEDEKWLSKIAVGIVLFLASFLIIPIFFVWGYLIEVVEKVIRKEKGLPEWNNWATKFGKGVVVFAIGFFAGFLFSPIYILLGIFASGPVTNFALSIFISIVSPIIVAGYALKSRFPALKKSFMLYKQNIINFSVISVILIVFAALTVLFQIYSDPVVPGYGPIVTSLLSFAIFPGFLGQLFVFNLTGQVALKIKETELENSEDGTEEVSANKA